MTAAGPGRTARTRGLSLRRAAIAAYAATAALMLTFDESLAASPRSASALVVVIACSSVFTLAKARPGRPICLGSIYALLLALFHAGLLVQLALGPDLELINPGDERWVRSEAFGWSTVYVGLALCALVVGYLAAAGRPVPGTEPQRDVTVGDQSVDRAAVIGIGLFVVGALLWSYYALKSGVSIIGGSYLEFLAATSDSPMPTAYLLMGFGIPVAAASRHPRSRRWALVLFALWSLPAFTLGLRGEVIIPAAAYAVVATRRRLTPLRPWMAALAVGVVAAGSAVRVIRQHGPGGAAASLTSADPLSGLTELGYSIRPLVVAVSYHAQGEDFVGYGTYLAPVRRVIMGRLLGYQVPSVAEDPTVFGSMIARRIGPIGGSVAAEAYRSGGVLGMLLVLFLVGVILARIDATTSTLLKDAAAGMAAFSLFLWIRNDFTPVPVQMAVAVAVLLLMWLFGARRHERVRAANLAAPPPQRPKRALPSGGLEEARQT